MINQEQHHIKPKTLFWLLAGVTSFAVLCLAYAELPGEWWKEHTFLIVKFIAVHVGLELLRAAILTVNVQIMKVSGNQKYYVVLGLTILASIGIGISIYHNHLGKWEDPFMWASQVLNFLVFSGELSLSFLLAGQKVDYLKEYQEAQEALESDRQQIETLRLDLDSVRDDLGKDRHTLGEVSRLLGVSTEAIGDNRLFIDTLNQTLDKHRKALGELKAKDRLGKEQLRAYSDYNKISIDGVKGGLCQNCNSISRAPSNKVQEWECAVCKEQIKI